VAFNVWSTRRRARFKEFFKLWLDRFQAMSHRVSGATQRPAARLGAARRAEPFVARGRSAKVDPPQPLGAMGDASIRMAAALLRRLSKTKGKPMLNLMQKTLLGLGLAGALAIGAPAPVSAAPLPTATVTVKNANPDVTTDVRWRGGPGPFFVGATAGLIGAAAFGAYGPYPYYYGAPYGYYPYGYRPYAYYGGAYPYYGRPYYGRPYYRHRYARHYRRW
jgi:hypothetical protein